MNVENSSELSRRIGGLPRPEYLQVPHLKGLEEAQPVIQPSHQPRHPSPSRWKRPEASAATSLFRNLLIPLRYNRPDNPWKGAKREGLSSCPQHVRKPAYAKS